jgi:hypothetical protein
MLQPQRLSSCRGSSGSSSRLPVAVSRGHTLAISWLSMVVDTCSGWGERHVRV